MLARKVDSDAAFPLLYTEYFNKYQADLSMELTKPNPFWENSNRTKKRLFYYFYSFRVIIIPNGQALVSGFCQALGLAII